MHSLGFPWFNVVNCLLLYFVEAVDKVLDRVDKCDFVVELPGLTSQLGRHDGGYVFSFAPESWKDSCRRDEVDGWEV